MNWNWNWLMYKYFLYLLYNSYWRDIFKEEKCFFKHNFGKETFMCLWMHYASIN